VRPIIWRKLRMNGSQFVKKSKVQFKYLQGHSKRNYINSTFKNNANNSFKRMYPKKLILFHKFIYLLYLLFGNPQYLHNKTTFWATLSCFHEWNVFEMKKTAIYKILLIKI
jgi:hypothetical protein